MAKPTFVCVPGAWHSPVTYAATMTILNDHGYPTIGLPLPSVGASPPNESFDEDIKAIRSCLTKLVEEEKEVVLVIHSYSGLPGTEASVGLGREDRESKGLEGGVVRLVYVQSLALPVGMSADGDCPEWMKYDMEKGIVTVTPEDARHIFYNDLAGDEAKEWIAKLDYQSAGVYHSKTTYPAWKYIPTTYIRGLKDKCAITKEVGDWMMDNARKDNPDAFDVVEECDAGHCLMISRPQWLADCLRRAGGEKI